MRAAFLPDFDLQPIPDRLPGKGLVDDNNLYEWEIMIIGLVPLSINSIHHTEET